MFSHTVVMENVCVHPGKCITFAVGRVLQPRDFPQPQSRARIVRRHLDAEIILSDWDRPGAASTGRRPRLTGCRSKTRSPGPFSAGDIRSTVWRHR
jgi:hypothetical protein